MTRPHLLNTDLQRAAVMGLGPASSSRRAYTSYGYAPPLSGPFTAFTGERCDFHTGCYHLGRGTRLYSPGLMRFSGPDPLGPFGRGGFNVYAYCVGDPVNKTDPTGHSSAAVISALTTNARAIANAAYAGAFMALLTQKRAPIGAIRQLAFEGGAVMAGLNMQYSSNPIVQGVGLGVMASGVSSAVLKAVKGIYVNIRDNGWRDTVQTVGTNLRRIFKTSPDVNAATIEMQSPRANTPSDIGTGRGSQPSAGSVLPEPDVFVIDVDAVRNSNSERSESTRL
ncbi:hypothetical protein D3C81_880870 [compost metagenome]